MSPGESVARFSIRHPRVVKFTLLQLTLVLALLALLPTLWPGTFTSLHSLEVDTDPENMLPSSEPVRVYHKGMKAEMSLHDMIVVGVVNESHPQGAFNAVTLRKVYELTQFAGSLRWPHPQDPSREVGVIPIDVIAPSTVDNIEQGDEPGYLRFEWLMSAPPETDEEALAVREKAERIPFLDGTLVSEDGRAVALYLPLTSKDLSSRVYDELNGKIASFDVGEEEFHITGLPVAEDVFGVQMFRQMAISAPAAMIVIFIFMWIFFRSVVLIISPMVVAAACVVQTMGLLVVSGSTVHIMSSMIPIFILPIAVLDAVHILSEFFDLYPTIGEREKTLVAVMDELFMPMLYTSLTTAVGFGSLALVPIPPVQVFGLFVAFGVLMAWLWTILYIPAYIAGLGPRSLEKLSAAAGKEKGAPAMSRALAWIGGMTFRRAKPILAAAVATLVLAFYGIARIAINDNPIRWFTKSHPIRVADRVLNEHFGGTYMAYLALEPPPEERSAAAYVGEMNLRLGQHIEVDKTVPAAREAAQRLREEAAHIAAGAQSPEEVIEGLEAYVDGRLFEVPDEEYGIWDGFMDFLAAERSRAEAFKAPENLRFIGRLQERLLETGIVGKSNSLADIVKTVYRELLSGSEEDYRIPETAGGVAQTLLQYQNSHRPQDLWHFVTPDFRRSVIWVQLKSGDNRDMERVVRAVRSFMEEEGGGGGLEQRWFGLAYINVIWQNKMVRGMLQAFLGSFLIVFLMMSALYRSALWGVLSMVPLSVTIAFTYGAVGLVGKDYDMPVAVLSSLSLGLAVDYAIHFLSRSRMLYLEHRSWERTAPRVFGEPAVAISRNAVIVGFGFLPLVAAPLVPYRTVGVFIAAILLCSALASLLLLPALITVLEGYLFPRTKGCCNVCNCATWVVVTAALLAAAFINLRHFIDIGTTALTWVSLVIIIVTAQACWLAGRSRRCRMKFPLDDSDDQGGAS